MFVSRQNRIWARVDLGFGWQALDCAVAIREPFEGSVEQTLDTDGGVCTLRQCETVLRRCALRQNGFNQRCCSKILNNKAVRFVASDLVIAFTAGRIS